VEYSNENTVRSRISGSAVAAALLAFAVAGVCIRLGFWQLDRLQERRDRNQAIASAMVLPPLPLPDSLGLLLAAPEAYVYRRVTARGHYDLTAELVLRGRSLGGRPGVHLLSPLVLSGDTAVLVNRGWAPSEDAARVALPEFREVGPRRIEGILMEPPLVDDPVEMALESPMGPVRTFARFPLHRLRAQPGRPLLPLYVQQIDGGGDAAGHPVRLGVPPLDEGPHLGYAVQWFGFATVALVGLLVVSVRARRRG
jgi:surfeit locus 1 family protein